MTFRYIESPDGYYSYPLFATKAEADYYENQVGNPNSGGSHTHTYNDDPSGATWHMPNTAHQMDHGLTPVQDGITTFLGNAITWIEIPSLTNAQWPPVNARKTTEPSDPSSITYSFSAVSNDCVDTDREQLNFTVDGGLSADFILGVVWGETDEGTADYGEWDDVSFFDSAGSFPVAGRWVETAGQIFTYQAHGLAADTTYFWRTILIIDGSTYWSPSQTFTKSDCPWMPTYFIGRDSNGNWKEMSSDIIIKEDGSFIVQNGLFVVGDNNEYYDLPSFIKNTSKTIQDHSLSLSSLETQSILPRMTTAQMNNMQNATNGEMIYNTTDNKFYGRANGSWVALH